MRGVDGGALGSLEGTLASNVKIRGRSCSPAPADWGGVNVNVVAAFLFSPRPLMGVWPARAEEGVSG